MDNDGGKAVPGKVVEEQVQVASPMDVLKDCIAGRGPPLRVILFALLIEFAGLAMLIPVMPFFVMHELGLGASEVGILVSAFSVTQLIGAWAGGRISDAIGRYPVVVFVFAWAGMGMILTSFTHNFWEVLVVRMAQGLSGGTTALVDAVVLDVVTEHNRAAYVGLANAVKGLAFTIGPLASAALIYFGTSRRLIFIIGGICALISAVFCLFFLEESLPKSNRRPLAQCCAGKEGDDDDGKANCEGVNKGLVCVWYCRFCSAIGLGFIFSTYVFVIHDNFGWGDAQFAVILLSVGFLTAVLQFTVFPKLSEKFGASRVLGLGLILGMVAFMLMPQPVLIVHVVTLALLILSSACIEPSLPVLIAELVDKGFLGFANGGTMSFRALATIVISPIAGRLYDMSVGHAYYTGAACFALGTLGVIPLILPGSKSSSEDERAPLLSDKQTATA